MSLCTTCEKAQPILKKDSFTLKIGVNDTAEWVKFTDLATGRTTLVPAVSIYTEIACDINDELCINHSYKVELLDDLHCPVAFDLMNCDATTTETLCVTFYYVAAGVCNYDEMDVQTLVKQ
jgi:hypothetical protein